MSMKKNALFFIENCLSKNFNGKVESRAFQFVIKEKHVKILLVARQTADQIYNN